MMKIEKTYYLRRVYLYLTILQLVCLFNELICGKKNWKKIKDEIYEASKVIYYYFIFLKCIEIEGELNSEKIVLKVTGMLRKEKKTCL